MIAPGIGTRISAVADQLESRKSAARVMGVSSDALQRYIREENQPAFAPVARLCLETGASMEWMATGAVREKVSEAAEGGSHILSEHLLTVALELGEKAAEGLTWVPKAMMARVVKEAYLALVAGVSPTTLLADLQGVFAGERQGESSSESRDSAAPVRRGRSSTSEGG